LNPQVDLGLWHRLSQLVMGLIVLACLLGIFFWYLPVFQQNARMRQHIMELEEQIRTEEAARDQLKAALWNLRNDPKTIERLAREKLGYSKPGETVIFFLPPEGRR
jgi:cell division protein FtsB